MNERRRRLPQPAHATVDGHAYLELQKLAKAHGRVTSEYLRLYALEGFLVRLAASSHTDNFVLKGGVLLAAYEMRRATTDIDFAVQNTSNEVDVIRDLVFEISQLQLEGDADDGLVFDADYVEAVSIRDEDEYSGVRVSLRARLATAVDTFHVDVNVGDPIIPGPGMIEVPKLLGGHIELLGYPMTMVLAEKSVTALQRGTASTRWRDFGDIYLLTGQHSYEAGAAREAIAEVAQHRGVELEPIAPILDGYVEIAQPRYLAWRDRQDLGDRLPDSFSVVLEALFAYADPLIRTGSVPDSFRWDPGSRAWVG
jgi:hypothetical protein